MSALAQATDLIVRWEGFRAEPYRDSVGVTTVGYGFTHHVSMWGAILDAVPLTVKQGRAFLKDIVRREYLPQVKQMTFLKAPHKLAGYTSWAYNVGVPAARDSTLVELLQAGREEEAEEELMRWVHAGGRVLDGLVARRKAEKAKIELDEDLPPEAFDVERVQARAVESIEAGQVEDLETYIAEKTDSLPHST